MALVGLLLLVGVPARAAQEKYIFGFLLWDEGTSQDAQLRVVLEDAARIIGDRLGVPIETLVTTDGVMYYEKLNRGEIHFTFHSAPPRLENGRELLPLLTGKGLGRRTFRSCLYVKEDSRLTSIKDLAGEKVMLAPIAKDFYFLRKLLATPPDELGVTIVPGASGMQSNFYALSLDKVNVIFNHEIVFDFLLKTNPGPLKGIHTIACSDERPIGTIFYQPDTPKRVVDEVKRTLLNAHKDPAFKRFHPLVKMMGIKMVKPDPKEWAAELAIVTEAEAKGWDKEFERWVRLTGSEINFR